MTEQKQYIDILYRITLSYSVFGVIVKDGVVVQVPPIGKWMRGRHINEVIEWVNRHNGEIAVVPANLPLNIEEAEGV